MIVRFVRSRAMMVMRMVGLEESNSICERHAKEQRQRKLHPIVRMEAQFRQQIAERDANEYASRKRQGRTDDNRLAPSHAIHAEVKEQGSQGAH